MGSLRMIIRYWMKSKRNFWASFTFQLISVIFSVFSPVLIGQMVNLVNKSVTETPFPFDRFYGTILTNDIRLNMLCILFGGIAITGVFSYIFGRWGRLRSAEVSSRAIYEIRKDIQNAIYSQSYSYFDKQETGQLVSRATSDVDQTQQIFGFGLATGLQSVIQIFAVIIVAVVLAPKIVWIFLGVPVSLMISYIIMKKLRPVFYETRVKFGDMTNSIQENIVGSPVVRIFTSQGKERKKFNLRNTEFYDASVRSVNLSSIYIPLNIILVGMMLAAAIFQGGWLYIQKDIGFDIITSIVSLVGLASWPMTIFSNIMLAYVQADASLIRIQEVFNSVPDIKEKEGAIFIPEEGFRGEVEFDNVTFGYISSNPILHNISFKVHPGQKIAIIGTTGSGKSTIINLLPRFYDVNGGKITIDGIDIRDYKLKRLRKSIGIVSQEVFLFNKSIGKNIAYGKKDATLEEIKSVAKIANLDEFIDSLPDKYDTLVGERGTRLSGGQKQRLSIARALLVKPKILILDDSTSSVDVETEYRIQQSLEEVMEGITTFIITQRISTIRNADIIMLMDKGRIVGFGPHEKLIESNVLYKQIYETLNRKQKGESDLPKLVIPDGGN